ncbi:MAG TPA: polysaccharide deacetylase family protein [Iamia sp.]
MGRKGVALRVVMYHYVRPSSDDLPHLRYLPLDGFRRQLDHFAATEGFAARDDVVAAADGGPVPPGVVLTFDDGLADHVDVVLPELVERDLWGLFFVPSAPHTEGIVLDVHRIHHLLGRHGGPACRRALHATVDRSELTSDRRAEFETGAYQGQEDDEATTTFKRLLNYVVPFDRRDEVLTAIETALDRDPGAAQALYATPAGLATLVSSGSIVGSHGHSHRVMSRLSPPEQAVEVARSVALLDETLPPQARRTYCHPYGGEHTFTPDTERILDDAGCALSFSVEPRDVTAADVRDRPQALPRWDCNRFPHGAAAGGAT